MAGTAWRRASLAASAALLLTGCGATTQPQALTPMPDQAPADLCAMVPAAERAGLIADSTSDTADITGTPTEACSLRSQTGATPQVRTLVTWLQLDDSETALGVYESQCRAVDRTVFRVATGFKATGADRACAATSSSGERLGHHGRGQGQRGDHRAHAVAAGPEGLRADPGHADRRGRRRGAGQELLARVRRAHAGHPGRVAPPDDRPRPRRVAPRLDSSGAVLRPVLRGGRLGCRVLAAPRPVAAATSAGCSPTRWCSSRSGGRG